MNDDASDPGSGLQDQEPRAIRFLVESALQSVVMSRKTNAPRTRADWVQTLSEALISGADNRYQSVVASLVARGVSVEDIYQSYVPDAARLLGEWWVQDKASFVDVTVGASRLQALLRGSRDLQGLMPVDRTIPLGHAILMVIPDFEDHSLGAFVAADQFRRHGLWVHMSIGLMPDEIRDLLRARRFAVVGFSAATRMSLEKLGDLVEYLRASVPECPPIIVGGRVIDDQTRVEQQTGVDAAVKSVREAIERCRLPSLAGALQFDETDS